MSRITRFWVNMKGPKSASKGFWQISCLLHSRHLKTKSGSWKLKTWIVKEFRWSESRWTSPSSNHQQHLAFWPWIGFPKNFMNPQWRRCWIWLWVIVYDLCKCHMHGYNVECEERVVGDFLPSTEMEKPNQSKFLMTTMVRITSLAGVPISSSPPTSMPENSVTRASLPSPPVITIVDEDNWKKIIFPPKVHD